MTILSPLTNSVVQSLHVQSQVGSLRPCEDIYKPSLQWNSSIHNVETLIRCNLKSTLLPPKCSSRNRKHIVEFLKWYLHVLWDSLRVFSIYIVLEMGEKVLKILKLGSINVQCGEWKYWQRSIDKVSLSAHAILWWNSGLCLHLVTRGLVRMDYTGSAKLMTLWDPLK